MTIIKLLPIFACFLIQFVSAQQKSPFCDEKNVTGTCSHYEFYSLYRSAKCCEYEPTVCCYHLPGILLVGLFVGSGLAGVFLCGWLLSCCVWCFCGKYSAQK